MEELLKKLNKINQQGNYQVFYSLYGNVRQLDIRLFEGAWKEDKEAMQVISINYTDNNYNVIEWAYLTFMQDAYVNKKLNKFQLNEIIDSYLKEE